MRQVIRKTIIISFFILNAMLGFSQFFSTEKYPVYEGNDLGLSYTPSMSAFRIWSPVAEKVELILYKSSLGKDKIETLSMDRSVSGTWVKKVNRDLKGVYYVFRIYSHGKWLDETPDPYAKSVGTNGRRAVVVDLKETNPFGWEADRSPAFSKRKNLKTGIGGLPVDAIIYEAHVRDLTIDESSGVQYRGKFRGLTEEATMNIGGVQTALDHIQELGVTHVHLLPSYDFYSVDESKPDSLQYNWGYDPLNYNVPEGSYSTDPSDGKARIREFKQLIQAMHRKGLRVVMDVVYNHTMLTENSYFNQLVPGYYYRQKENGDFSNASACGNETASERPMMRKFMIESVKYWVKEYHIDGFRFDLMGIHDIETMNLISKELHAIKPDILLYGEGWTAGSSPIPDSMRALKKNAYRLDRIAVFSDDLRDGIKGSVFEHAEKGFASGKPGMEETIKFGVTAACRHPQVDYSRINYSKAPYAAEPGQVVSYCECHDNHVLWDKLAISNSKDTAEVRKKMHQLALTIVMTSQGISFLHAGTEFLRSKKGVENSFNAGDSINAINWFDKADNSDVYQYVRALVQMRKDHPAFRLATQDEISRLIRFDEKTPAGIVSYTIDGSAVGDSWEKVQVIYNGNATARSVSIGKGSWKLFSRGEQIVHPDLFREKLEKNIDVPAFGAAILYQE
ncbi:MAG: type I pullulanase [Chitinophagia bacterium]|jgi:pullulanase